MRAISSTFAVPRGVTILNQRAEYLDSDFLRAIGVVELDQLVGDLFVVSDRPNV